MLESLYLYPAFGKKIAFPFLPITKYPSMFLYVTSSILQFSINSQHSSLVGIRQGSPNFFRATSYCVPLISTEGAVG